MAHKSSGWVVGNKEFMDRALRRHLSMQAKKRALRNHTWVQAKDARMIGILARTPHPCSCISCGNPRHHFGGRTIQEIRNDESGEILEMING